MDRLIEFSDWMQSEGRPLFEAWSGALWDSALDSPGLMLAVVLLSLLAGLAARSLALALAVTLFTLVALTATMPPYPDIRLGMVFASIGGLALLAVHGVLVRSRHAAMLRSVASLQKKNSELQAMLDREIAWRMAAEPQSGLLPAPDQALPEAAPHRKPLASMP